MPKKKLKNKSKSDKRLVKQINSAFGLMSSLAAQRANSLVEMQSLRKKVYDLGILLETQTEEKFAILKSYQEKCTNLSNEIKRLEAVITELTGVEIRTDETKETETDVAI